jgi:cation diffusion facilitator CzcD-associated flavoprotein CzcO
MSGTKSAGVLPNGHKPATPAAAPEAGPAVPEYSILETPLGEPRPVRIMCVGAGASGLNLAHRVDQYMHNTELVIYEKNPEVGGTWFENRYPGCACDIPSHNYQFTWEPNPDWSTFYSKAPEILEYFKAVARKHDLYKYINLSHRVVSADWDESKSIWNLQIEDLATGEVKSDWGDFMITASGVLNNWRWPDIPGIHSFGGQLVHSANWDDSVDWRDKRVAVLGCGSSGVQIVAAIQPDVAHLTTFIRTPTWITSGFAQSKAGPGGSNFSFSNKQKKQFREDPEAYLQYRKEVEQELNVRFKFVRHAAAMCNIFDSTNPHDRLLKTSLNRPRQCATRSRR